MNDNTVREKSNIKDELMSKLKVDKEELDKQRQMLRVRQELEEATRESLLKQNQVRIYCNLDRRNTQLQLIGKKQLVIVFVMCGCL